MNKPDYDRLVFMLSQFIIVVSGSVGMWLIADPRPSIRRWGARISLIYVPLILWSTFWHGQWGMFLLNVICLASYVRILLECDD